MVEGTQAGSVGMRGGDGVGKGGSSRTEMGETESSSVSSSVRDGGGEGAADGGMGGAEGGEKSGGMGGCEGGEGSDSTTENVPDAEAPVSKENAARSPSTHPVTTNASSPVTGGQAQPSPQESSMATA